MFSKQTEEAIWAIALVPDQRPESFVTLTRAAYDELLAAARAHQARVSGGTQVCGQRTLHRGVDDALSDAYARLSQTQVTLDPEIAKALGNIGNELFEKE